MTAERRYTTVDKTAWGEGSWQHEPDKIQFRTEAGYWGLLRRNEYLGNWCGYVGVPPAHPLFNVSCVDIADDFSVHGGLTFSDRCAEAADEATSICHITDPSEAEVWWFGFDAAHGFDFLPGNAAFYKQQACHPHLRLPDEIYRDEAYMRGEVERLAAQLKEVETRSLQPNA